MIPTGKGRIAACAVATALLFVLAVPIASSAPARGRTSSMVMLSNQILREVNRVRAEHGLRPLAPSSQLSTAAIKHSRAMVTQGFFAHESADGSAFWFRIKRYYRDNGYRYWAVGENLVWASPNISARQAVQMWLKSRPHRANLLSRRWQQIGLAAVHASSAPGSFQDRAVTVVTADFGVRR